METETVLRQKGMLVLIEHLGRVNAERFIALMNREPFDYTEWRHGLFKEQSVRELSAAAMKAKSNF
ncbi:MAG: hypothetical protein FWG52_02885 [Proteobacteria bacterium]|jgi:hypothetical protein|nr:hypothetical protein [Pseudomonadota bacterium]